MIEHEKRQRNIYYYYCFTINTALKINKVPLSPKNHTTTTTTTTAKITECDPLLLLSQWKLKAKYPLYYLSYVSLPENDWLLVLVNCVLYIFRICGTRTDFLFRKDYFIQNPQHIVYFFKFYFRLKQNSYASPKKRPQTPFQKEELKMFQLCETYDIHTF